MNPTIVRRVFALVVACVLLAPLSVVCGAKASAWSLPLAQLQDDGAAMDGKSAEADVEAVEKEAVRVDISVLSPPLKDYDKAKGEVCGFTRNLLDIISRASGLTFLYLEPKGSAEARSRLAKGESDIWVCYGGNCEPMEAAELGEACVMLPMVRVCRKGELFTSLTRQSLAIVKGDYTNRGIYDNGKGRAKEFASMDQCYEAVRKGEADYLVDYLHAAQNRLLRSSKYKGLVIQQMPAKRAKSPFRFMFSKRFDPATRDLFERTLSIIPPDEMINCLVTSSVPRGKPAISTEKVVAIGVCIVVLALLLTILILNHQRLRSRDVVNELEDANRMAERSLRVSRQSQSCLEFLLNNHDKRQAFEYICKLVCLETGMEQCWIVLFGEKDGDSPTDDENNLFFYVDDGADGGHLHAVQGQEEYDLQRNTLAELVDQNLPLDKIIARTLPSGKFLIEVNDAKRMETASLLVSDFFERTNAGDLAICSIRGADGKLSGYVALTGSISFYGPEDEQEGGIGQMLDVYVHTLNIFMNAEDTRRQLNMATEQRERIFSASPVAMIMYDAEHQVVMSNDKAKEMTFGMERRLGPRKCIHAFCEGKKPEECPVRQAFATGKTIVTAEKYGGRMYSVSTVPIYDNGIVVNVMQTFTDQTALLNSERHFKKTSELLSGILSTMPCAAFIKECGDQIRYLLASDYLENAMNWEKGYVKGKTCRELFGDKAEAFDESDRLARENGTWSGMLSMKTPSKLLNLFCVKRHIKDPDGHDMIIGVELDMTENIKQRRSLEITHEALQTLPLQKNALACLPPMLANLSNLLDSSTHLVVKYDGKDTVAPYFWNQDGLETPPPALLEAMGSLRNYDVPAPLLKQYGTEGAVDEVVSAPLDAALKAVGAKSVVCVPIFHQEQLWGRLCFFKQSEEPFSQVDCFIVQDVVKIVELALRRSSVIDELAAKERRLHMALVDAKEAASARGEFLATMSHEIRTPLNSIIGIAKCMDVKDLSLEQAHEYAHDLNQPSNALLRLLDDINELSNISSGHLDLRSGECNMGALFDELKAELAPKANSAVKLEAHVIPKEFPVLKLNDHCIRQLLDRLIGNALKFTEAGMVSFGAAFKPTSSMSGTLELEVKDSGCGIDDVMQKIMFDPFVHHEVRGRCIESGMGLGLPIVKAIVEKLDGTVTVDSAEGQGSSFHIRIPNVELVSAVTTKAADQAASEEPALPKGLRVLVVDDVPLNLKITSKYLERLGAECRISNDPNEALDILKTYKVDVVLTDLWMPGMNGLEMVKAIHAMPGLEKLPVVAVTADIEVKNDSEENELVDILHKPITRDSLRNVLLKCIGA